MTSLEQLYGTLPVAPSWNPAPEEALIATGSPLAYRIRLWPQSILCTIDPPPVGIRHQIIAGMANPRFPTGVKIITWTLLHRGCIVRPTSPNWSHVFAIPADLQFRLDFGSNPSLRNDALIELEMLTIDSSYAQTHRVFYVSVTINIRFCGKHIQYIVLAKYGSNFALFLQHVLRG